MKKAIILLVAAVLLAPAVFGTGSSDQQKAVLRWGSVHAETTITTQMMRRIIEEVNSKTGGRVEIQGYPNSSLGGSRDLVEGVQAGIMEMISEGPAQFASWIPMASIAEAPYIFRDIDHMNKALNGPFGDRLNEEFLKKNVRLLGSFYYGTRQLTTTRAEVRSVKDMQGLKIRVPEVKAYVEMINSWGARPTPIPFGDLYMSLQTNVADGQENPLPTFDGQKFYEIQKYLILTDHIICPNMIFINEDAWKKISPGDQQIIRTAVANGIAWNDVEVIKSEELLKKDLADKGVTVITPDVESFRAVTGPWLVSRMEADWGKGTWEFVQDVK
ncbi:MAG: sialic acid TRAP transporter substrate-binding protein SiaP [Treponema sp.]|jgi:tripartite ATP-independent transporter DctP family solute receptor|nr:sialic acid TRAP transporter substrate-binding protein SiaP [Treponema sp.]